ncbi:alpha/beta fold hydrolase [Zavarzinia compransoris]|uniref:HTH luxR-type domain-containing protein n=1 Tax=Zavarzinia compransoris TaxID=1264899 RepID=A0A317E8M8_9PROT|nr:alpha/beta fold hydrolase [Zavarzinia compransoris]PWR23239.1 hypothetical protein DKG75_01310 [Zavarzinia compransoris]TDP46199.1 pimeloyl-ACP methyl ester carboxylesterase [Zavarzinia compransoris]
MIVSKAQDLIVAIYAATLSPDNFYAIIDRLDALLFADQNDDAGEDDTIEHRIGGATLAHAEMAYSIQQRIGLARTNDQKVNAIIESVPNPSYVVTKGETLVAANGMALAKYGAMPVRLDELVPDPGARRQVRDFLQRKDPGLPLAVTGHPDPERSISGSIVISSIDPDLVGGALGLYLLSVVDFGFDDGEARLLRDAHGLTAAEARVALMLAGGLRASEIAAERGVSLDTVRTQIKVIKGKTGVRDIPELVRQLCGFSAGVLAPKSVAVDNPAAPRKSAPVKTRRRLRLADGRTLDLLEQGAADGRPVLLFHNIPYGIELPAAAIAQAYRDNLRIIAPFRPGMGDTDPVHGIGVDDLLTQAAQDCRELLDQLGIRRAVVLSHAAGSPFALRFARLFPGSVSRMIGISRPPAWRQEWLLDTPKRQRFMLRLARHVPRLLPVVAWAMMACLDSRFASEFVIHLCKDGAADAKAVGHQETVDLIAKGSVNALRNGLDCLRHECLIAQMDFTAEARATAHKFHILHGDDDHIVPLAQTLAFARDVPGTTVEVVEAAGQLLFFSHWQRVLSAIVAGAPR